MHFVIECYDKPNTEALRLEARPDHLEYLAKFEGRLKIAGPLLAADSVTPHGSLIIIELDDLAEAQRFAAADPYATAGLFGKVAITPWRPTVGTWRPAHSH